MKIHDLLHVPGTTMYCTAYYIIYYVLLLYVFVEIRIFYFVVTLSSTILGPIGRSFTLWHSLQIVTGYVLIHDKTLHNVQKK